MRNDELATAGINAYKNGNYDVAINCLTKLLDNEPSLWTCRLYLAMAYQSSGMRGKARSELDTICQWTTDQTIKRKALEALRALHGVQRPEAYPDAAAGAGW
jgi:thioredoxin-like negative regulator of GroEL